MSDDGEEEAEEELGPNLGVSFGTIRQRHITLIYRHKPHTAAAAALLCHRQQAYSI